MTDSYDVAAEKGIGVLSSATFATTILAGHVKPGGARQALSGAGQAGESDEAICAGALYGTPDEIALKLEALRDAGAAYVLLNSAGGPASLRRFAHEVRPAFADASTLQPA